MESLQRVLEIANRVKGTASKVEINQHQCSRLAKVLDEVGKSIQLLIMAKEDDGRQSAEFHALDALLHVFESGELLVLEYAGPNWFRNLVVSRDNKEAFEEIYDDLRDILNNLFGIRFDRMYYPLSDDAAQDQEEMNKRLYDMKQSIMVGTSTANFERSSELHTQSYSLEIAFGKLDQDRIGNIFAMQPRFYDMASPLTKDVRRTSKYLRNRIAELPEVCKTRRWFCCAGLFRRRPRKLEIRDSPFSAASFSDDVADNLGVKLPTIKLGEKDAVAVDLRVEPSTIKLGEVLGTGSYSEVRVAEWVDCEFAVKIMKTSDVRALQREVGIHMKLRHPHIVQLVGFSADEDKCMILMELMDGDLQTHIASQMRGNSRKQPFSLSEAVNLMKQIAVGMQFLHRKGILHGDLKTQNVLVMRKHDHIQLKITDFGVSQENLVKTHMYEASFSGIVGSGYYRAPEILKGTLGTEGDVYSYSGKADVYSFAMTAYEILTGLTPFQNKKSTTRQSVVDGDRPELPLHLNSTLKQLVERCWHGEQDVRPNFEEVSTDLRSLQLSPEVGMHRRGRGI